MCFTRQERFSYASIAPKPSASESSRCGVITHGLLSPCELPDKPQGYDIEQVIGYKFEATCDGMDAGISTHRVYGRSTFPSARGISVPAIFDDHLERGRLYNGKILVQVEVISGNSRDKTIQKLGSYNGRRTTMTRYQNALPFHGGSRRSHNSGEPRVDRRTIFIFSLRTLPLSS